MIKVNKPINLKQLDIELNDLGLIATVNENKEIIEVGLAENNTATEAQLKTAINAHIALPEPELTVEQKLASVGLNVGDLKAALGL
jgi:uncharacterized iron-regulated protein